MRSHHILSMTRPYSLANSLALASLFAALWLAAPALQAQGFPRNNEQDRAREDMLDRKVMPFSIIKRRTESSMGDEGTYVGTAPSPRDGVYRMQFLRKDGKVIWVDVDGKTGNIIGRTK
jgi:hypothetical protein